MPFGELLELFTEHVTHADASMQLRQRLAWNRLVAGHPLLEGIDRLENLGVTEVQIGMCLEPTGIGWLARVWRHVRMLFGAVDVPKFRLVAPRKRRTQVSVTIRVTRQRDGSWGASAEPSLDTTDLYVNRIVA